MTEERTLALERRSAHFAVVTICTPNFIPGTLVMIHGYLRHNPWWRGDFVVLTDVVTDEMEKYLTVFPRVRFRVIGKDLHLRAAAIARADETGKIFESHFYSLELFNLTGYEKLFYVDSDMLVRGSFAELFEMDDPMICVGDSFYYKDELRDGVTYNRAQPKFWNKKSRFWDDNFNAGLILFDGSLATPTVYRELTEMVTTEGYSREAMRLQDQMIQNIYFRGRYTLVSAKYNFRLGIAEQIGEKDGVTLADAVVIHYTARKKPWLHFEALDRMMGERDNYFEPFRLWQDCWIDFMDALRRGDLKAGR